MRNNEAWGLGKSYPTTLNNAGRCWPTIKKLTWLKSFRLVTVLKNVLPGISKTYPVNLPSAAAANCCDRLHKASKFHVSWRTKTSDGKDYGEFFFLFLNLIKFEAISKKSTPGKFAYIWLFQRIEINATKFEKTRIDFKSYVFAAVAVVVGTSRSEDGDGRENVAEKVNSCSFNLHHDSVQVINFVKCRRTLLKLNS